MDKQPTKEKGGKMATIKKYVLNFYFLVLISVIGAILFPQSLLNWNNNAVTILGAILLLFGLFMLSHSQNTNKSESKPRNQS